VYNRDKSVWFYRDGGSLPGPRGRAVNGIDLVGGYVVAIDGLVANVQRDPVTGFQSRGNFN